MEHLALEKRVQPVVFAAGDEHLSACNAVEDILLPPGVQLRQHVIQQHHRILSDGGFVNLPVRQLQTQGRSAHLALGAEMPGLQPIYRHGDIVLMRAGKAHS